VTTEEPSQEAMMFFLWSRMAIRTTTDRTKGFHSGILVGVLFPLFHLLPECLGFFLFGKRQAGKAILEFATLSVSRYD
jgi:hypothetical protein